MVCESPLHKSSRQESKSNQTTNKQQDYISLEEQILPEISMRSFTVALLLLASQFASFGKAVITEASAIVNGIEFSYVDSSSFDFFGGMVQCRLRGGELASIRTEEEFVAVEALANLVAPGANYYIGSFQSNLYSIVMWGFEFA